MDRARFEKLVEEAVDSLPSDFADRLDNVTVIVEDLPSREQLDDVGLDDHHELLGLYEGIPLTERPGVYAGFLPDRISIFRIPIERVCGEDDEAIRTQVRETVMHELGHYFGMDEDQLRDY
ncbi:MAG: metallopeptidase family protein [Thermoleophilia bacterium]